MSTILNSTEILETTGLTLVHSFWQAGIIALLLVILLKTISAEKAALRYNLGLASMTVFLMCVLVTWSWIESEYDSPTESSSKGEVVGGIPTAYLQQNALETTLNAPSFQAPELSPIIQQSKESPKHLATWITPLWAMGALLMLLRTFRTTLIVTRIKNRATSLCDQSINAISQELSRTLKIAQPVAIRLSDEILSPAVIGILRPAILFPVALLARISTDQIKAVLAHELAHIRRNDYLVNLAQRVIESLFYFNPFIWLINRQIRTEREACCDTIAAEAIGEKESYAETLISVARFLRESGSGTSAQPAFGGNATPSSLLDRFKRLLDPQYQPRLGLHLPGLLLTIPLICLLVFGLEKGSGKAVAIVVEAMSDKERVVAILALQETHPAPLIQGVREAEPIIHVTGKVIMADGSPLPDDKKFYFLCNTIRPGISGTSGFSVKADGTFELTEPMEEIFIYQLYEHNYAPVFMGPFKPDENNEIKNLVIKLKPLVLTKVRILSPDSEPVKDADIVYGLGIKNRFTSHILKLKTDEEGIAIFPAAPDPISVNIAISAVGFEADDHWGLSLKANRILDIKMVRSRPVTIHIHSAESGRPVQGAAVELIISHVEDPKGGGSWNSHSKHVGTTDSKGNLQLANLRSDTTYHYIVSKPGYRPEKLVNINTATKEYSLSLYPPIVIQGKILGSLESFRKDGTSNEFILNFRTGSKIESYGNFQRHTATIQPVANGGTFTLKDLPAGKIQFQADNRIVDLEVSESTDDFVINLLELESAFPKRQVTLRLIKPTDPSPPIEGFLMVNVLKHLPTEHFEMAERFDLSNGRILVDVEAPGSILIAPYGLVGYYVPNQHNKIEIHQGEWPLGIAIMLKRAGALSINFSGPISDPEEKTFIHVFPEKASDDYSFNLMNDYFSSRQNDKKSLSPLPLNTPFRIVTMSRYFCTTSDVIGLTEATPLQSLNIARDQGSSMKGTVTLPSGKPAADIPVHLGFIAPFEHSFGLPEIKTDSNGMFEFPNVNRDIKGSYYLLINPKQNYVPISKEVRTDWRDMRFDLQKGLGAKGRIVELYSDKPIADVLLNAHDPKGDFKATTRTDANGRFQFSTLSEGKYTLHGGGVSWQKGHEVIIKGGSKTTQLIKATIPKWSPLYSKK
ncbi:M48 family metalloprotease [Verrucomicrobia bacterium]|nr:M48 family metalloprotease [Verrucomicrobiota bacterium]